MLLIPLLQSVALVGGTVHTMTPGDEPSVRTLVIEEGRIAAIGSPDLDLAEETTRIDVTGLHLVPGLIDGMVNHDADHDALYIASGVTLVRDTGNDLARIMVERSAAARDRTPGPELFVSGMILEGFPPSTTEAVILRSAEEAELKLPRLFELDVDFLSIQNTLPEPAWRKAIELAHAQDKEVWGPVPAGLSLNDAIDAGQDGLIGLQHLLPAGTGWLDVEEAALRANVEAFVASRKKVTPLLQVYGRTLVEREADAPELAWLGPHYLPGWLGELELWKARVQGDVRVATERSLARLRGVVQELGAAGVAIVPGSGAPNSWLLPGRALHEELEQWVRAGLSPAEVLHLATAGAAEALGVQNRGTLAVGQIADVLVVGSDPRESLTTLRRPEIVIVRGTVLEREDLDERLDQLAEAQAQRRAELAVALEVAAPDIPEGEKLLAGTAETIAAGVRVSSEHFVVVRMNDGRLAYCTRIVTPGSATTPETEVQLVQRVKDHQLESFDTFIRSGGRELSIKGLLIGGLMNVERRLDGNFVDNNRAKESISLVDVRSATAPLFLAQHLAEGHSYVIYFEDMNPVVARWEMEVSEEDGKLLLKTGEGWMICGMEANGAPKFSARQSGNAHAEVYVRTVDDFGGPGLPLPAERVYRPEDDTAREAPPAAETEDGR